MFVAEAVLRVNREASVASIQRAVGVIAAAILGAFTFVVVRAGAGLVRVGVSLASALLILQDLDTHRYSVYFFILPIVLLNVTLYSLAIQFAVSSTLRGHVLALFAAGLLTAFSADMRNSYLPTYVLFATIYCLATFISSRRLPPTHASIYLPVWIASSVAAFIAGVVIFQLVFIRPLIPEGGNTANARHPIAHPLVLSLAIPPNDLADREGIRWDDLVGLPLAQRVIPEATYLGPLYERALFAYYRSLWRRYPHEMFEIYVAKLALAGRSMFDHAPGFARGGSLYWATLLPLAGFPIGFALFVAYATTGAIATWRSINSSSTMSLVMALLSVAALMAYVESVLITPVFYLQYSAALLFGTIFLALTMYEWLIDHAATFASKRGVSSLQVPIALASAVSIAWYMTTRILERLPHGRVIWLDGTAAATAVAYGTLCAVVYGVYRLAVGRVLSALAALLVIGWMAQAAAPASLPDLAGGAFLIGWLLCLIVQVDRQHDTGSFLRVAAVVGIVVGMLVKVGSGPTLAGWLAPPLAWNLIRSDRSFALAMRTGATTACGAVALLVAWLTSPHVETPTTIPRSERGPSSQGVHVVKSTPDTPIDPDTSTSALKRVDDGLAVVLEEPVVHRADGTITLEGRPKTRYAFVFQIAKQHMKRGDQLVAQGRVNLGGVSIGFLNEDGSWGPYVNIVEKGEFLSVVQIAKDGNYWVVLANCATGSSIDVSASFSRLGFLRAR
jgi:hypothetical protein